MMMNKLSLTAAFLSVVVHRRGGRVQSLQQKRRYHCVVCGKSYMNKGHLKRHMTLECIGIAPKFICSFCKMPYKRKEMLNRHVLLIHNIDLRTKHKGGLPKTSTSDKAPLPIHYSEPNFSTETVWLPSVGSQDLPQPFQSQHLPPQSSSSQPHFDDQEYYMNFTSE